MYKYKPFRSFIVASFICIVTALHFSAMPLLGSNEMQETKTFNVQKGQTLTLKSDIGSIEVTGWDRDEVKVDVTKKTDKFNRRSAEEAFENFEIEYDQSSNGVRIEARLRDRDSWFRRSNHLRVHFDIMVPREFNVDLSTSGGSIGVSSIQGELDAHTSGGSMKVSDIEGNVDINTSGGSIAVDDVDGNLDANTSGGSVKAVNVTGNARAKSSGGGITLENVGKDANAYTSGGPLNLRKIGGTVDGSTSGGSIYAEAMGSIDRPFSLKTSGGSITLDIPKDTKADIDASTSGGSVRVDIPITVSGVIKKEKLHGSINGGGPLITLRTSGGSININGM